MDVRYALGILLRRVGILLASGTLAAAAAFVASGLVPPTFESRATLLVGQSSGAPPIVYEDLLAAQILANTYASLSTTTPVLDSARERSGISITVDELREHLRVEATRNSPLIVVITTFPTGEEAARVANAVAEATAAIGAGDGESLQVSVVDPAEPSPQPIAPRPLMNAALAGAVGLIASAGFVLMPLATARRTAGRGSERGGAERLPVIGQAR